MSFDIHLQDAASVIMVYRQVVTMVITIAGQRQKQYFCTLSTILVGLGSESVTTLSGLGRIQTEICGPSHTVVTTTSYGKYLALTRACLRLCSNFSFLFLA